MTSTISTQIDLNWLKIDNDILWDIKNIWCIITVKPNFLGDSYEANNNYSKGFRRISSLTPHCWGCLVLVPSLPTNDTNLWNNALIWGYFWIVRKGSFRGCWGGMMINVEFWGCDLEILQLCLKVWLLLQNSSRINCICTKVCIELGLLRILCRTSVASLTCDTNVLLCNDNIHTFLLLFFCAR